jgi:hypothetical protein
MAAILFSGCGTKSSDSQKTAANTPQILEGLQIVSLGKHYDPQGRRILIGQSIGDSEGNTSARNTSSESLVWKPEGYFMRNRDLGQVFTAPQDFTLDAIVLRTGPAEQAICPGTPGAAMFVEFFEVAGVPRINDNRTPPGTKASHGFSDNHRCDDFIEGIIYTPIYVVTGGVFPDIAPTCDENGKSISNAGKKVYLRFDLTGQAELKFLAGKQYAFMVGFTEEAPNRAFSLYNHHTAHSSAVGSLTEKDAYTGGWGIRREGNGAVPPQMVVGATAPADEVVKNQLIAQSVFGKGIFRYTLSPTTDGYPDVDTYRDLEFYMEVK